MGSPIVLVNRSLEIIYPDWMRKNIYPELEKSGPKSFDVSKLGKWFHNCQKTGISSTGDRIYKYLVKTKSIQSCLNLADLKAIENKGIDFYLQYLGEDIILTGWKTIIDRESNKHKKHYFFCPYLKILGSQLILDWGYVNAVVTTKQPVFFFKD